MLTDLESTVLMVNPAFSQITGYSAKDIVGKTPKILSSGRHDRTFFQLMFEALTRDGRWVGEIWNRRKDGQIYLHWQTVACIYDEQGNPAKYLALFNDMTERRRAEDEIRFRANYDTLTHLPNRALLKDRLKQAMATNRRENNVLGVLFLDLDHFKRVNDTLGHGAGDQLLKVVAQRLCSTVRESDTVARLGGDEFVLLLPGLGKAAEAGDIARKVIRVIEQPITIKKQTVHVGCSIGITLYPEDGADVTTLFRNADLAMYRAKESGRNTWRFYEGGMMERACEQMELESELRQSLEQRQLSVRYQPIVTLTDRKVVGLEALSRWQRADGSWVSPCVFVPLAEEMGVVSQLGQQVLEQACEDLATLTRAGSDLYMSVNLSSMQIPEGLPLAWLEEVLQRYDIRPGQLMLEITEGLLLGDSADVQQWLEQARKLGLRIALDDFGTGYSSLSYLKRFPVDVLKIDQSFIADLTADSSDRALVSAIIAMSHSLDLAVIAEGVETGNQLSELTLLGCLKGQGYLFAPAMELAQIAQLEGVSLNQRAELDQ